MSALLRRTRGGAAGGPVGGGSGPWRTITCSGGVKGPQAALGRATPYSSCSGPGWGTAAATFGPVEGELLRTSADGTRLCETRYRCTGVPHPGSPMSQGAPGGAQ
ncbi:hypothetical protein NDU88_007412 [Pleurodeles waltl]|uniref:Uncharacterized protein n=1 Tax=Pleurodeles waltl TaxID=8319 RepID=A0AAV7NT07_PLEWA|nr:hypothetical protein NDU88_007412 [Pleurodeles waltl]